MKRILSLALTCLILAVSLAPAASAAEVDGESMFFEVLDWCLPNGGSQYIIYGTNTASCYFGTPAVRNIQYIDILCEVGGGSNPLCQMGGDAKKYDLNVEHISGYLYRFYGEVPYYSNVFNLYFTCSGMAWVRFHSVRISYSDLEFYETDAYCEISSVDYDDTIHYVPTDIINAREIQAGSNYLTLGYALFLYSYNWKKFDYMEFKIQLGCQSVTSVSASIGGNSIPCETSFVSNDLSTANNYFLSVRLDFTQLSRDTIDVPLITITGDYTPDTVNFVSVLNVYGCLRSTNGNLLSYLFRDLTNNLRSWFTMINNSLKGNSAPGNAFKNESAGLIDDLNGISDSMNSVNRPSLDTIDVNFAGDITDATVLMSGLFTEVTGVPWLSTIILASCTLGLISYILYGKD